MIQVGPGKHLLVPEHLSLSPEFEGPANGGLLQKHCMHLRRLPQQVESGLTH